MEAHKTAFKKTGSTHDISIWEWDSEKRTEEVIAVLCVNSCKGKDYPGEENGLVLNQKSWVPVLEGGIIQYEKMLNQKGHGLFLLLQNSSLYLVTVLSACVVSILAFRKYQAWGYSTSVHGSLQPIRKFTNQIFVLGSENQDFGFRLQGRDLSSPNLRSEEYRFLQLWGLSGLPL